VMTSATATFDQHSVCTWSKEKEDVVVSIRRDNGGAHGLEMDEPFCE